MFKAPLPYCMMKILWSTNAIFVDDGPLSHYYSWCAKSTWWGCMVIFILLHTTVLLIWDIFRQYSILHCHASMDPFKVIHASYNFISGGAGKSEVYFCCMLFSSCSLGGMVLNLFFCRIDLQRRCMLLPVVVLPLTTCLVGMANDGILAVYNGENVCVIAIEQLFKKDNICKL